MRGLFNSVVILFILATLALVAYFVHQRQKASYRGDSYTFSEAPVDLVREVSDFFASEDRPKPPPTTTGEPGREAAPAVAEVRVDRSAEYWQQGRECYLAGDFAHALELIHKARTRPSGQTDPLESRAALFAALLGAEPAGARLTGPPQALITLPGGDPFYAEVVSETEAEITFKRPDGVGARVKKADLRDLKVARTPEQKRELAEQEYQRRHAALDQATDYLALGRFCRDYDLTDHLTYVLERGLEAPGDGFELALFEEYKRLRGTTGAATRAEETVALMKQFFRSGEYTRAAVLDTLPAASGHPGIAAAGPRDAGGGAPPSGIGAANYSTPRSTDPRVNALLAKADGIRREADQHYAKAAPGMPDRGMHREQAIKLYEEAIGLYEEVQEDWGVNLDSVFKDMLTKRYGLLKDKPIR